MFISVASEPLDGVSSVVAVKDLIDVRGFTTTGGGRVLPPEPAASDATVIENIRVSGAGIVGKTNLDEFGCGVTSENGNFGDIPHPTDPTRVAGGSSGGSAAAVALGMCDWALGTDTGGSIRIPAALCGVVGMKPTTGLVPTEGVFPLSPSLDVVGPLAPTVTAVAEALDVMTGAGSFGPDESVSDSDLSLVIPAGWLAGLDAPTAAVWEEVSDGLPEVNLPARDVLKLAHEAVLFAEAAAVHGGEARAEYGQAVRDCIARGLEVSAVDYIQAIDRRERLADELEAALAGHDALLLPTTPRVAPLATERDEVVGQLLRFTWPFSFTMSPALSLPGPGRTGLPVGIQVVGRRGDDRRVLTVSRALERAWRG